MQALLDVSATYRPNPEHEARGQVYHQAANGHRPPCPWRIIITCQLYGTRSTVYRFIPYKAETVLFSVINASLIRIPRLIICLAEVLFK